MNLNTYSPFLVAVIVYFSAVMLTVASSLKLVVPSLLRAISTKLLPITDIRFKVIVLEVCVVAALQSGRQVCVMFASAILAQADACVAGAPVDHVYAQLP